MYRRNFLVMTIASAALGVATMASAQQPAQPSPYSGVSQPPSDLITATPDTPTPAPRIAKPSAAVLATPVQEQQPQPSSAGPVGPPDAGYVGQGNDGGAYPSGSQQAMYASTTDPDGDIVRPRPARPGELMAGTTMRVRLVERISSTETE